MATRPGTISLYVDDLTITRRTVEVASTCACGADLTSDGALWHFEWAAQRRRVWWGDSPTGIDIEWGDIAGGESFLATEWQCVACGATLAAGGETHNDASDNDASNAPSTLRSAVTP